MNAPDYLRALQRTEELFDSFLAYVPPHSGGSDLQRFPPWMEQQLSSVGIALPLPPMQRFRLLLEKCDWARNTFTELQPRFTEDERHQLTLGEDFTIGTSHSAEFNGAVVQAPTAKTCIVIVLPIGAMLLAGHVAMLTTLHSPGSLCQILVNGGHEDVGFREGPIVRQLRKAAPRWAIRRVRQRYPTRRVAAELGVIFHRYASMGVVDPPDIIRDLLPLPLLGSHARVFHPLEPGSWLQHFAMRFLVLHECAHVLLGHVGQSSDSPSVFKQEFDADQKALQLAIRMAKTPDGVIATCLGAWLFLESARWVEAADEHPAEASHHPPAADRLKALRPLLSDRAWVRDAQPEEAVMQFEETLKNSFTESAWIREGLQKMSSFRSFISRCCRDGHPEMFKDQFPRWVLFGAPRALSRQLARTRLELERAIHENPNDDELAKELALVMWAYKTAEQAQRATLARDLERTYCEFASQR